MTTHETVGGDLRNALQLLAFDTIDVAAIRARLTHALALVEETVPTDFDFTDLADIPEEDLL